jgi:hypothetical protein
VKWAEYARKAGKGQMTCANCGKTVNFSRRLRVLADFLTGAHAFTHAECILSRDLGVYKSHFKDLKVVSSM